MWKILYQLASPRAYYKLSARIIPWCAAGAFLFLFLGVVWGLVFAPADYQQGDAFRLIYIHVPCAFLSMTLYGFMGFLSILLWVWRIKLAGLLLNVVAQLGALMAGLALITGSLWGKPMWGTFWIWDARLTSELILFFLYVSVLAAAQAFQNKEQGDRVVAILCLVGLVDLPIIHYSVSWWSTLHQGATLTLFSKPKIDAVMLYPLLLTLLGFSGFCMTVTLVKSRQELLWRERRQRWVKALFVGVPS